MFIIGTYTTKERRWVSSTMYQNVDIGIAGKPIQIKREPISRNRDKFVYYAIFNAPENAEHVINGKIEVRIIRKSNKYFDPTELIFENDLAIIE